MILSIIMQSYLGDYPGARSKPEEKFIRAVYSVIAQTSPKWELIIVSDGCQITERIYNTYFKNYKKIKFKKVNKPEKSTMYTSSNSGDKFYRGAPRKEGVKLATGDWICYLDSDDIFLRNGVKDILKQIRSAEDMKLNKTDLELRYIFNECIIENLTLMQIEDLIEAKMESSTELKREHKRESIGDPFEIEGLEGIWISVKTVFREKRDKKVLPISTAQFLHKRGWPEWEWGDSESDSISEDNAFIKPITLKGEEAKHAGLLQMKYYVRCHMKGVWDL